MLGQDDLYKEAVFAHGPALDRLARAYEADIEDRRDLLQEIHLALWRSFETFDDRCSLRTWIYRIVRWSRLFGQFSAIFKWRFCFSV
jgi:RNA polymerase sigma-70 factor (ECF subfamily)